MSSNQIKQFIRNLSAPAEFCLVLFIGFGFSFIAQGRAIAHGRTTVIHDRRVLFGLGLELLFLPIILLIGRIRGWSLSTFGWRISRKGTMGGILLFVAVTVTKILVQILMASVHPERAHFIVAGLTVPVIIFLSIVNPFFEEVLEAGYFIHWWERFGMWPAVLASSLFRGVLHLYQGINGAVTIFAGGVLISLVYWRWRQLWPLYIAHLLDDLIGLLYLAHLAN